MTGPRCPQRDPATAKQCNRKVGHELIDPKDEERKDPRPHRAYGQLWWGRRVIRVRGELRTRRARRVP